eukprot:g2956.t1
MQRAACTGIVRIAGLPFVEGGDDVRCAKCYEMRDTPMTPRQRTQPIRILPMLQDTPHTLVFLDLVQARSAVIGGKKRRAAKDASGFKKEFKPYHATSVPKATDLSTDAQEGPATTAMLRNIPNKFSQKALLEEIDAEGFSGLYDFFYVPMDVRNKTNVGYAFINFLDPADMSRFSQHFEGYRFRNHNSGKLRRNVQQLTKKAVLHFNNGEYKPVVFRDGSSCDLEEKLQDPSVEMEALIRLQHSAQQALGKLCEFEGPEVKEDWEVVSQQNCAQALADERCVLQSLPASGLSFGQLGTAEDATDPAMQTIMYASGLKRRRPERIYPGHGPMLQGDAARNRPRDYIQHRHLRLKKALELLEVGARSFEWQSEIS